MVTYSYQIVCLRSIRRVRRPLAGLVASERDVPLRAEGTEHEDRRARLQRLETERTLRVDFREALVRALDEVLADPRAPLLRGRCDVGRWRGSRLCQVLDRLYVQKRKYSYEVRFR
jgi:hypothetical protein